MTRYFGVKTVRFSQVVEQCGQPEIHLLLMDPAKDAKFQKAIKSQRVMTVFQSTHGQQADHAEVAFEAGTKRQFLIFPNSLGRFAGGRVVGIKYELMESGETSRKSRCLGSADPSSGKASKAKSGPPPDKVVAFPKHHHFALKDDDEEEGEAIAQIKAHVRHAMEYLEKGKSVAAFNLLKRIVDG
ncbi:hypothetical protein BH09VER1_BH09VER1_04820 [soil metagenome]